MSKKRLDPNRDCKCKGFYPCDNPECVYHEGLIACDLCSKPAIHFGHRFYRCEDHKVDDSKGKKS